MGRGQATDTVVKDQFSEIFGNRRGGGRSEEDKTRPEEDGTQTDTSRPGPGDPGFSQDGIEFDDGGIVEWPEGDGLIRLRDADGDMIETWYPDDQGWEEYAKLFGVTAADFEDEEEDEA